MNAAIRAIDAFLARASARTIWFFVRVLDDGGHVGWGEATWQGHERDLAQAFARLTAGAVGASAEPCDAPLARAGVAANDFAAVAIASAIDQALWDAASRRERKPLREALGPSARTSIPLYANVNRRTIDRTPEGFAASAAKAASDGFDAIKIAPFDGVKPGDASGVAAGIACAAATRAAIGPARALYVDCHWRFDEAGAIRALDALAEIGLQWFECPIAETDGNLDALKRLRARANACGALLAGCETRTGVEGFRPFLDSGAYDVVMPDAKYAGGLAEFGRIAAYARARGAAVAPHNPSGPICHAVSLQLCAGLPGFLVLEHQYDESPVFDAIVANPPRGARIGPAAPLPEGPGLGVALDAARLAAP